MKAFNWTPKQIGELSWGQIDEIEKGLQELGEAFPEESEKPSEELATDAEYQNRIAKLLLSSRKQDGTVDLQTLMGKLPATNG